MSNQITELQEPQRGWRYHSGQSIYVERFREGRLIVAQFQATGIPFHARHEDADELAFNLQVDGESLYFGWDLAESRVDVDASSGCPETVISLKHTWKPLQLDLRTTISTPGRVDSTHATADWKTRCGGTWKPCMPSLTRCGLATRNCNWKTVPAVGGVPTLA